jgi:hypothetical protein
MKTLIGIRREDINKWERRTPLIPSHARELVADHPLDIRIQPSEVRVFTDEDYRLSGIPVTEDLGPCPVIVGLKEIPIAWSGARPMFSFRTRPRAKATTCPCSRG